MSDTITDLPSNGELPPVRENLVAQAERVHQEILHDRDLLRKTLAERDTTISGLKAQLSVAELEASQLRSRAESINAVRDEAVARRAELEAVLKSVQSVLRAFNISNEPLIRETTQEEAYADNLTRDYGAVSDTFDTHPSDGKGGRK